MAIYAVECTGIAREVYLVEASSEREAMANWASGELLVSEVSSAEPVSAQLSDED